MALFFGGAIGWTSPNDLGGAPVIAEHGGDT
jgi:hypothetical protein